LTIRASEPFNELFVKTLETTSLKFIEIFEKKLCIDEALKRLRLDIEEFSDSLPVLLSNVSRASAVSDMLIVLLSSISNASLMALKVVFDELLKFSSGSSKMSSHAAKHFSKSSGITEQMLIVVVVVVVGQ